MGDVIYVVRSHVVINGRRRDPGDEVSQAEILTREPHRLGSLIRRGHIEPKPAPAGFGSMTKKALLAYADEHGLDPPAGTAAELRAWMEENA